MVDFNKLLSVKVDDVEKPQPIAVGTYVFNITTHQFGEAKNEKKTPYVRYGAVPMAPMEDVDQAELAAAGGMEKFTKRPMSHDFWLTDDSLHRLQAFLRDVCGINCSGRTFNETIPEAVNHQVLGTVKHRIAQNGDVFAYIDSFAAMP